MFEFLRAIMNGIMVGGIYSLMALSLTLIFGVVNILNFAHGDLVVFGSILSYWLFMSMGMDPLIALIPTFITSLALGALTYFSVIKFAVKASVLDQIVITFGLVLVLEDAMALAFGREYMVLNPPYASLHYKLGFITISLNKMISFGAAVLITLGLLLILNRTYLGLAMKAVSQDAEMAALMGIDVSRTYLISWTLGVGIASISGTLLALVFPFNAYSGISYVLKSFSIVALGGLGSIVGSIVGGILLGLAETTAELYASRVVAEVISYLILVFVLAVKPTGLFGKREA